MKLFGTQRNQTAPSRSQTLTRLRSRDLSTLVCRQRTRFQCRGKWWRWRSKEL